MCCNTDCTGTCQACNVSGKKGTCTPYTSGTDPDSECLGKANSGTACAGTCDGKSACTYPTATTSCGNPMCAAGKQTTYGCGGDGSCAPKQTSCGQYICGATACLSSCTSDTQCAASAWCKSGKCVPKIADGGACGGNNQCTNKYCVDGTCCHTSCALPNTCGTGTCLCNGATCGAGHVCKTWYIDQDQDGYGVQSANDTAGCDNVPPTDANKNKYVLNHDDCDDTDANAHPGQTKWFTMKSKGGTWDYNCDQSTQFQHSTAIGTFGATCQSCGGPCFGVPVYGYTCTGACAQTTQTYKSSTLPGVGCGAADYLYSCSSSGETACSAKIPNGCH